MRTPTKRALAIAASTAAAVAALTAPAAAEPPDRASAPHVAAYGGEGDAFRTALMTFIAGAMLADSVDDVADGAKSLLEQSARAWADMLLGVLPSGLPAVGQESALPSL
ncbi:hypothetical protein ACLF6K_06590 [Streptomyces xanthophaeus]|uniref:hypothetical protein n=1 Tax=Streptomyces xanthophaeus TaxID=67385 RepID=UPI003990254C